MWSRSLQEPFVKNSYQSRIQLPHSKTEIRVTLQIKCYTNFAKIKSGSPIKYLEHVFKMSLQKIKMMRSLACR